MDYTKLLPEIRQMIDEDKAMFPNLVEALIEDIKNATVVSDLKVRYASTIIGYYHSLGKERRNNFELDLYSAFGMYQG
jgi:hypothetical protein